MRLLLEGFTPDSTAAPGELFPNHQAKLITEVEHNARLLVVAEAKEIRSHIFDHLHFFAGDLLRYGRPQAGVVFVPRGTTQQQAFAVELERPVVNKLVEAKPKALGDAHVAMCAA